MKVAILIMSSDVEPSLRNINAFKDTVVKYCELNKDKLNHEYRFFVYRYGEDVLRFDDVYQSLTNLVYQGKESVYSTFEKTRRAFIDVREEYQPDVYVRVNISTHINIPLFDTIVHKLDNNCLYCNRVNSFVNPTSKYFGYVYPRGDFMIMFDKHCLDIINNGVKFEGINGYSSGVDHVDDCIIGLCLYEADSTYYRQLVQLNYNYNPNSGIDDYYKYSIATRLKSTPPNTNSGYSWDDNEYRLMDVDKFYQIQRLVESEIYEDVDYGDLLSSGGYPIMRYSALCVSIDEYDIYINAKNAGLV